MRPYNFLRLSGSLCLRTGTISPPARESRPTRQRSVFGRHAKELGKKPGKYCESGRCRNRLLRRASPLISGEAGSGQCRPKAQLPSGWGVSGSGSKAVDPEAPDEAGPRRQICSGSTHRKGNSRGRQQRQKTVQEYITPAAISSPSPSRAKPRSDTGTRDQQGYMTKNKSVRSG